MPERMRVDCVVVGGGPAGAGAAETLMKENPDKQCVLLEKRARPHGTCAGGVGFNWLDEMQMRLPEHVIETRIDEVAIHGPTESSTIHKRVLGVNQLGYVLDRWGFDEWLLSRAVGAGANVMRNTTFTDIKRDNGKWVCTAQNKDGTFEIAADYVVDASGPGAVVAKKLGFKIDEEPEDIHTGLQYTVELPDHIPLEKLELWFRRDTVPGSDWAVKSGYVWSFTSTHPYWDGNNPMKAGRLTRVGIGVDQVQNRIPERSAKKCLQDFMRANPDYDAKESGILSENGGLIPTGVPFQTAYENIFLAGDSGRHVSALHGGGIWFGRVAGEEAGRTIAKGGDARMYEEGWQKRIGWTLKIHYALKKVLYDLSNDDMDLMIRELEKFDIQSANPMVEIPRAAMMVAKHPRFVGRNAIKAFHEVAKATV